jgi:hypothetical protein
LHRYAISDLGYDVAHFWCKFKKQNATETAKCQVATEVHRYAISDLGYDVAHFWRKFKKQNATETAKCQVPSGTKYR